MSNASLENATPRDDGGTAFPVSNSMGDIYSGMSLRDYFAAMAMQGMVTGVSVMGASMEATQMVSPAPIARDAYVMADAMLKARK